MLPTISSLLSLLLYLCATFANMDNRIVYFLFIIGVLGCNEIKECDLDDNRKFAVIEFYHISDSSIRDTLIFNQIYNLESPYNFGDTILEITGLPLDPSSDFTSFVFETDSGDFDLDFDYKREFSVYDVDCDPSIKFYDLTGSSTAFDSVAIVNPILNRDEFTNVKIYF